MVSFIAGSNATIVKRDGAGSVGVQERGERTKWGTHTREVCHAPARVRVIEVLKTERA